MLELFTRTARTQSYFGSKIATETFSGVLCTAVTHLWAMKKYKLN